MSAPKDDPLARALERFEPAKRAYLNAETGAAQAVTEAAQAVLEASRPASATTTNNGVRTEKPSDFLQRVFWAESALSPILVVAVHIKLFQQLRDAGEAGVSSDILCEESGIKSKHQLERILRHLASTGVIGIKQASVWLSTPLSEELATDHFQHSILFCHHVTRHVFDGFPEYFERLAKEDPAAIPGPFQLGMKTSLPFFDYLGANHPYGMYFNYFMQAYRAGNSMWYESYPVAERLVKGFDPSASDVFLLDLGGGKGHDLAAFAGHHAQRHPGKLILQDQPSVIAEIPGTDQAFEPQAHDFFTPEPVRHARAYYLHSILHDWGGADCQRILANLKPALKSGYSKVLFNEIVLSEDRPSVAATNMDIMMLGHLDPAYERTESAWRQLIESAEYKVVGVFSVAGAAESVIEAELA